MAVGAAGCFFRKNGKFFRMFQIVLLDRNRTAVFGADTDIISVRHQTARFHIVGKKYLKIAVEPAANLRIFHRTGDFNPACLIACHDVSRRNIDLLVRAGSKGIDPGMFQEPSDNTGNYDIFCFSWNPGDQAADAPYDQINLHACTGCLLKLVNQFAP